MSGDINWFLMALFNPLFLLFILGFFFFGKLVGRMVSRPNVWKLLILRQRGSLIVPGRSETLMRAQDFAPIRNCPPDLQT